MSVTVNSFEMAKKDALRYEVLTKEEEVALGRRIAKGGAEGKEAQDKLVECNLRWALKLAGRHSAIGVTREQILSAAHEGLVLAAEKFDYSRGNRFITYATWWINQRISRFIQGHCSIIRKPLRYSILKAEIAEARLHYRYENGHEPGAEQLADILQVSVKQINSVLNKNIQIIGGLAGKVLQVSDETRDPEAEYVKDHWLDALRIEMNHLPDAWREVASRRFGISFSAEGELIRGETDVLDNIANDLDITRERVRQIEALALSTIKNGLIDRGVFSDDPELNRVMLNQVFG